MPTMAELAKNGIRYQALEDEPKPEEDGHFSRGFKKAMVQIPETLGGTAALVGDVTGIDGLRDYGLRVYEKNKAKDEALTRDSDSFSNVLEGDANLGDFLKSGAGYVAGQALTALGTGGVGGFIGSQLAKRGIRNVVANGVESQAAKIIAEKAAAKGAKIGAGSALFGSNLTQEAGSIYPEALEQAKAEGRTLDGGDKARVVGTALAAAGVETLMDARMLKGVMGGGRKMVVDPVTKQIVPESLLKSVPREIVSNMGKEAATEGIQTGIERVGAGQSLTTADAVRDYVDSMALGGLGGGLGGAAGALHSQKVPETGTLTRAANVGIDEQILQLTNSPDPWISFPDGSVGKQSEVDAYINSLPETNRADARAKLLGIGDHAPKEVKKLEPTSSSQEAADSTLKAWSAKHEAENLDYVQKLLQAPGAKGLSLMVVPHASGKGYTALPSKWLSIDDQVKYAALQKEQTSRLPGPDTTAPNGNIIVDSEGGASKETYADKARAAKGKKAKEDDAQLRLELGTPVPNGVSRIKESENVESPTSAAGDKGVIEGNAGTGSDQRVGTVPGAAGVADAAGGLDVGAQVDPDANAGAAPELILNSKGGPFKAKVAAVNKVKALGIDTHEIVPVDGGYAVRKKSEEAATIDEAAHAAATSPNNDLPEPTQAQKEAGNYQKGHVNIHGMDISVENPAGSVRSGVDRDGQSWENTLQHHYGYIKGTIGADKDHIDAFIGKNPSSEKVFVVDQVHPHNGKFDEHKIILGADTLEEAKQTYADNYAPGWKGAKDVSETSVEGFKTWLKDGDTKMPFAGQNETSPEESGLAHQNEQQNIPENIPKEPVAKLAKSESKQKKTAEKRKKSETLELETTNDETEKAPSKEEGESAAVHEDIPDAGEDIPVSYFKKTKVAHDVWIEDEKKFESAQVPAKDALASVRDDIANYSNLLNCLRGH